MSLDVRDPPRNKHIIQDAMWDKIYFFKYKLHVKNGQDFSYLPTRGSKRKYIGSK